MNKILLAWHLLVLSSLTIITLCLCFMQQSASIKLEINKDLIIPQNKYKELTNSSTATLLSKADNKLVFGSLFVISNIVSVHFY